MSNNGNRYSRYGALRPLIHDYELFGKFTEDTIVKCFGAEPESASDKQEWNSRISFMLDRVKAICLAEEQAEGDEDLDDDFILRFEGNDISPIIHDKVYGNSVTTDTISNVIGPAPTIPDSPDHDAFFDALSERKEYRRKAQRAEKEADRLIAEAQAQTENKEGG